MFAFAEIALKLNTRLFYAGSMRLSHRVCNAWYFNFLWWSYIGVPESLGSDCRRSLTSVGGTHHVTPARGMCISFPQPAGASGLGPVTGWSLQGGSSLCTLLRPRNKQSRRHVRPMHHISRGDHLIMLASWVAWTRIWAGTQLRLCEVQNPALKAWDRRFGISLAYNCIL